MVVIVFTAISGCSESLSPTGSEAKISKAEFDKIKVGMRYEEVKEIIGGECTLESESGKEGTDLYTVMYGCDGEGELGANVQLMFQGGKLDSKTQMGLK
jgi:hypothetical protein